MQATHTAFLVFAILITVGNSIILAILAFHIQCRDLSQIDFFIDIPLIDDALMDAWCALIMEMTKATLN